MHAIFGADKYDSGKVLIDGQPVHVTRPQQAISLGMSMVPESRKEQGLVLINSVGFNLSLACVDRIRSGLFLSYTKRHALAGEYIDRMRIKTRSEAQSVFELSGGNQQKVLLGKWLANRPKILILDEPTRGVDVGAKTEIYATINELAAEGMAIILVLVRAVGDYQYVRQRMRSPRGPDYRAPLKRGVLPGQNHAFCNRRRRYLNTKKYRPILGSLLVSVKANLGILAVLVIMVVSLSLLQPVFLTPNNILSVGGRCSAISV